MGRFVAGVVVAIFLLVTSGIAASIAIGSQHSPSAVMQRFHLDTCAQPCVMGVTLGKTTYNDALALFDGRQDAPDWLTFDKADGETIALSMLDREGKEVSHGITLSFTNGVVDSVRIESELGTNNSEIPTLADVTGSYGLPRCAESSPAMGNIFENIYIVNPQTGIMVTISGLYWIDWDTPVGTFSVVPYVAGKDYNPCTNVCHWHGPRRVINTGMGGLCAGDTD